MNKEKCLVTEAREKCPCDFCKQMREFERISLEQYARLKIMEIIGQTLMKKNGRKTIN